MKINIELTETDLKRIVLAHIQTLIGDEVLLKPEDVQIETKSKQNYKAEWETAAYRARVDKAIS